jgi:hypothetical protein
MKNNSTRIVYSLSTEELALALGLINRPDLGKNVLSSIYPNINESESDVRLSAASHSLLARAICSLNATGHPVLNSEFENALLPLAKFDYLIQASIVFGDGQVSVTTHVRRKHTFTARLIQGGVVNVLTHGQTLGLPDYFLNIFEEIGVNGTSKTVQGSITLGDIGKIASAQSQRQQILSALGWTNEDSKMLSEDLDNQQIRATIIRMNASDQSTIENLRDTKHQNVLLLKGKTKSWGFRFESTKDEATGQAFLLDRNSFTDMITSLVS